MIEIFRDEYRWLSNFHYFEKPMPYLYNNGESCSYFKTNEHFYIAMKTRDNHLRTEIANHPSKGLKAFGRSFELREDWDDIKLDVMLYGLMYKFSRKNPTLRHSLIQTGDVEIQEGNWWNDKYWGVCLKTGEGGNNLGKLIMKVRGEIQDED